LQFDISKITIAMTAYVLLTELGYKKNEKITKAHKTA